MEKKAIQDGTKLAAGRGLADQLGDKTKANARKRKPNAQPSGGGGGGWKETNERMAKTRAALQAGAGLYDEVIEGGGAKRQTSTLNGELTHRTTVHPYDQPESESGTSGTSIFDPVLCELAYRWFCPPGGLVLDPFAGGSVRGIVAGKLGRRYHGIDLRPEQVAANEAQARRICRGANEPRPTWSVGDSRDVLPALKDGADLVFSCPPYADLEVYSDDPRDLSTLEYEQFRKAYREIIAKACVLLRPDRFAVFVVGDARGPDGFYYGLPIDTVDAFESAGLRLYNQGILVTAAGSLPIRTAKQFAVSRKLGTTHQHIQVFCKGDARKATSAIGPVEFGDVDGVVMEEGERRPRQENGTAYPAGLTYGAIKGGEV